MQNRVLILTSLVVFTGMSAFSQPQAQPGTVGVIAPPRAEEPKLTRFDLDFAGGTPKELVAAIQKAMGRPVNTVIPEEYTGEQLPPLKMKDVTVAELFRAIESASVRTEPYVTGANWQGDKPQYTYQQMRTSLVFQTDGRPSDNSIWYFIGRQKPPKLHDSLLERPQHRLCRFYSLASYLDRGLAVEDITTAIQTGWKMLGDKDTPTMSFHKETRLLIAVGEPAKLETIDAVLTALSPTGSSFVDRLSDLTRKATPAPAKAGEKPKTEN